MEVCFLSLREFSTLLMHNKKKIKKNNNIYIEAIDHASPWCIVSLDIFNDGFTQIINRHVPFKRFKVKGCDNPWFSPELADIIQQRNSAWAKAKKTGVSSDWLDFIKLRNRCSSLIKQAKSDYYLSVTTENLNDPRKFLEAINSLSVSKDSHVLPAFIMKDSVAVSDKMEILKCFNEHFILSGSLFDTTCSATVKPCTDVPVSAGLFNFTPFTKQFIKP